VSQVPSESGVFGLVAGDSWLIVAESWNLKARLLDLINTLNSPADLLIVYELCPESEAEARCRELYKEFMVPADPPAPTGQPPGISFWSAPLSGERDSVPDSREV